MNLALAAAKATATLFVSTIALTIFSAHADDPNTKTEIENIGDPASSMVDGSCGVAASLPETGYNDPDETIAAYLYENPDVCFWETTNGGPDNSLCVLPVEAPTVPQHAVTLPAPNGSNDTYAIQAAIAGGGDFVGNGSVYRLNSLQVRSPTRIWNMPSTPATGARKIAEIRSPDVRIYNSLIDGKNQPGFHAGWDIKDGSHRFTLVNSGVINIYHSSDSRAYAVLGAEVDDIHVTCNRFDNIVSRISPARVLWMAPGRTGTRIVRGGVFANNSGDNLQGGNSFRDADVVVLQGHLGNQIQERPFLIMANRFVNGGKRFVKWQTGNSKALSNFYHWKNATGPLGGRSMSEAIASFTSNNIARNNHLKYSAEGGVPKAMFFMVGGSIERNPHNNHFNNNTVEYEAHPPAYSSSTVFVGRHVRTNASTGYEFANSTFTENNIIGPGNPSLNFWFREGWHPSGASFIHEPNTWESSGQYGIYRK